MKLYYSTTSPYSRKVRLVINDLGLNNQVEEIIMPPLENPLALQTANPLGKIPTLVINEQFSLYDSSVICHYLIDNSQDNHLIPTNENKWRVLRGEALANGIMDSGFALVMENLRPSEQQSSRWKTRWTDSIARALDEIEHASDEFHKQDNLAHIAIASALSYLVFRLPNLFKPKHHPHCYAWLNQYCKRGSMLQTNYHG